MNDQEARGLHVKNLLYHLIDGAPKELRIAMQHRDLFISAPLKFIEALHAYNVHESGRTGEPMPVQLVNFQGIWVVPTHEPAITLFHKDYPFLQEERLIHRIPIKSIQFDVANGRVTIDIHHKKT